MAAPTTALAWLPLVLLVGCPSVTGPQVEAAPDAGVLVHDLVFEIDDAESRGRLVVKARRASFTDLPGRGRGELTGVEARASQTAGQQLVGEAEGATIDPTGVITLQRARVTAGDQGGLAFTADSAKLGLDGSLQGRGVKARLREPARDEVER